MSAGLDISPEAKRLIDIIRARPTSEEDKSYILEQLHSMSASNSGDYIMSVLFPDIYDPIRFPMVFPNPTAVFKLNEVFDFTPGRSNKFFIEFFPQNISNSEDPIKFDNSYLYIHKYWDTSKNSGKGGFNWNGESVNGASPIDQGLSYSDNIGDYFEQVVLRAACIKIYYVGEIERISGYFESCIDYYYDENSERWPTETEVVKGFYRQFAMPSEGMRVVWLPKDYKDYNFDTVPESGSPRDRSRLCIYGSSLETEPIRIEIVRHFEGFPRTEIRDYVDTRRPSGTNAQRTMENIGRIHTSAPGLITIKPKDVSKAHSVVKKKASNLDTFFDRMGSLDRSTPLVKYIGVAPAQPFL